jgi:O-antigen/teichoic acid export membrane protein
MVLAAPACGDDGTGMAGIRRAFLLASAERYLAMAINMAVVVILARLLTPAEYGLSVLGSALLAIAEAIRDFGGSSYLVQQKELTIERVRTIFTIMLLLTLAVAGALAAMAGPIAAFYATPGLENYLYLVASCFLLGPIVSPLFALLRREMAFERIAFVNVFAALVHATVAVVLASLGFSFMSFAWASLVSGVSAMLLCLCFRPDISIFRPSLSQWRDSAGFARFTTAAAVLSAVWEFFPVIVFGRILGADAVGLYSRAAMICGLPEKVLLAGVTPVALPALSARAREGHGLKSYYLGAVTYITGLQWPALIFLGLLAHPLVMILLGPQWTSVVPLVQIMAAAMLLCLPAALTNATLVAAGGVRDTLRLSLIVLPLCGTVVTLAAFQSLTAVALSMLVTLPLQAFFSAYFVRRHLGFHWRELGQAVQSSVVVAALCAIGPATVLTGAGGFHAQPSLALAAGAAILHAVGWLAGLWVTGHPLMAELQHVGAMVGRAGAAAIHRRKLSRGWLDAGRRKADCGA